MEARQFRARLRVITLILGFVYIVYYFVQKGFNLDLNIVNMIFLFLGILLHGDLRKYVDAIGDAAAGAAGILLQFPFYAPAAVRVTTAQT